VQLDISDIGFNRRSCRPPWSPHLVYRSRSSGLNARILPKRRSGLAADRIAYDHCIDSHATFFWSANRSIQLDSAGAAYGPPKEERSDCHRFIPGKVFGN
jgi:hypothetical protein